MPAADIVAVISACSNRRPTPLCVWASGCRGMPLSCKKRYPFLVSRQPYTGSQAFSSFSFCSSSIRDVRKTEPAGPLHTCVPHVSAAPADQPRNLLCIPHRQSAGPAPFPESTVLLCIGRGIFRLLSGRFQLFMCFNLLYAYLSLLLRSTVRFCKPTKPNGTTVCFCTKLPSGSVQSTVSVFQGLERFTAEPFPKFRPER